MSSATPISSVSSDAFTEIFQSMSEGLIMVDEDGKIVISNPVAEQIFGYEPNELVGLSMEKLLPEQYRSGHINFRKGFITSALFSPNKNLTNNPKTVGNIIENIKNAAVPLLANSCRSSE